MWVAFAVISGSHTVADLTCLIATMKRPSREKTMWVVLMVDRYKPTSPSATITVQLQELANMWAV